MPKSTISLPKPQSNLSNDQAVPDGREELRAEIGKRLAAFRSAEGLSLKELSDRTAREDPRRKGIPPSQILKYEKHKSNSDVPNIIHARWLSRALDISLDDLAGNSKPNVHVVRNKKVMGLIDEVNSGMREIVREKEEHAKFIKSGNYRYIGLDQAQAEPDESFGSGDFLIQAYLFNVGPAPDRLGGKNPTREEIIEALAAGSPDKSDSESREFHSGEELICVLDGELEFSFLARQKQDQSLLQETFVLRKFDTVQYSSTVPHAYRSEKGAIALFVYALSPSNAMPIRARTRVVRQQNEGG